MKIFLVILLFIVYQSLLCQDYDQIPAQITIGDKPLSASDYLQTNFILGWHWGSSRGLSCALGTNQYDLGIAFPASKPEHICCVSISGLGMTKMSYTSKV